MPSAPLESTLRAYNPDEDPLAGYDAGLLDAKAAKLAKQEDILKTLGGETRTTVNFAVSRDAAALVATAGAAVNTALADIPRVTPARPKIDAAVVGPDGTVVSRGRQVTPPAVETQNAKVRHLEQRVLGLTNHIVSGNAADPLQTARPSLRGGIWH